jgi:hypothetical protein
MDKPMGEVKKLDQMVNEAGYLRLMVSDPLAMNMSNTVPLKDHDEKRGKTRKAGSETGKKISNLAFIRKPLLKLYDWIFRLYYEN